VEITEVVEYTQFDFRCVGDMLSNVHPHANEWVAETGDAQFEYVVQQGVNREQRTTTL
jgi:hypothetical protein